MMIGIPEHVTFNVQVAKYLKSSHDEWIPHFLNALCIQGQAISCAAICLLEKKTY